MSETKEIRKVGGQSIFDYPDNVIDPYKEHLTRYLNNYRHAAVRNGTQLFQLLKLRKEQPGIMLPTHAERAQQKSVTELCEMNKSDLAENLRLISVLEEMLQLIEDGKESELFSEERMAIPEFKLTPKDLETPGADEVAAKK